MSGIIGMNEWERDPIEELKGKSQKHELVKKRAQAAHRMYSEGLTVEKIADKLNRHHSTIVHYLNNYRR